MIQLDSSHTDIETTKNTKVAATSSRVSPWLTPIVYPIGQHFVLPFYFGKIEFIGKENLPTSGPVIVAPTHRSRWDAILVPATVGKNATGRNPRYMVSIDEMKGIQGWFIRQLGGFAVDVKRPSIATLRHGIELLQQREMLVIFPEGGDLQQNRQCIVNHLQPGLARLALQAESSQPDLGIKVVPISIYYDPPAVPWRCQVKICIGSPLLVAEYSTGAIKKDAKRLTQDLELSLKQLSSQTQAEVQQDSTLSPYSEGKEFFV
jgi:1-acyl-sn-glycerol-3-phosphate acyltransferase